MEPGGRVQLHSKRNVAQEKSEGGFKKGDKVSAEQRATAAARPGPRGWSQPRLSQASPQAVAPP